MSDTSVIMDESVVLKHIDIKLKQLDATEKCVMINTMDKLPYQRLITEQ